MSIFISSILVVFLVGGFMFLTYRALTKQVLALAARGSREKDNTSVILVLLCLYILTLFLGVGLYRVLIELFAKMMGI